MKRKTALAYLKKQRVLACVYQAGDVLYYFGDPFLVSNTKIALYITKEEALSFIKKRQETWPFLINTYFWGDEEL